MKIMATSFKRSLHALLPSCPQTCSKPLLTHASTGDSWTLTGKSGSVPWGGHCSFLLGPGAHRVLSVASKSLFPQSCISSGGSMVGLMATSSNRAYALPRSAAPCSRPLLICTSRRHSDTVLAQSLWVGLAFCALPRSEQLRQPGAL